jgi:chemotaxis protein histidine kinase CheA
MEAASAQVSICTQLCLMCESTGICAIIAWAISLKLPMQTHQMRAYLVSPLALPAQIAPLDPVLEAALFNLEIPLPSTTVRPSNPIVKFANKESNGKNEIWLAAAGKIAKKLAEVGQPIAVATVQHILTNFKCSDTAEKLLQQALDKLDLATKIAEKEKAEKERTTKKSEKEQAEKQGAAEQIAAEQKAEKGQAGKQDTKSKKAEKQDAKKQEAETQDAETQDAETQDAEKQDAETQKAESKNAESKNAETQEAEKQEAEKQGAEKQGAEKQEAEKRMSEETGLAEMGKAEKDEVDKANAEKEQAEKKKREKAEKKERKQAEKKEREKSGREATEKMCCEIITPMKEHGVTVMKHRGETNWDDLNQAITTQLADWDGHTRFVIGNTGAHFVVLYQTQSGQSTLSMLHDGCDPDGLPIDTTTDGWPSKARAYISINVEVGKLKRDWEEILLGLKIKITWEKLTNLARREHHSPPDLNKQSVRSCSIDVVTFVAVALGELFEDAPTVLFTQQLPPPIENSKLKLCNGLREDIARVVLGAVILYGADGEDDAPFCLRDWDAIQDGVPNDTDWDAFSVLDVLWSLHKSKFTVEELMVASFPKKEDDLGESIDLDKKEMTSDVLTGNKTKAPMRSQRSKEGAEWERQLILRFYQQLERAYWGYDESVGELQVRPPHDVRERVAITGLWKEGVIGRGGKDQNDGAIAFIMLDTNDPQFAERHSAAISDKSGFHCNDVRSWFPVFGPQLSGFYSERKDAIVFAPTLTERDHDKQEQVILAVTQCSHDSTMPTKGDLSNRNARVMLHVGLPNSGAGGGKVVQCWEFENYIDHHSIVGEPGCLVNGTKLGNSKAEQHSIRLWYKQYKGAAKQKFAAGSGYIADAQSRKAGGHLRGGFVCKIPKLRSLVCGHAAYRRDYTEEEGVGSVDLNVSRLTCVPTGSGKQPKPSPRVLRQNPKQTKRRLLGGDTPKQKVATRQARQPQPTPPGHRRAASATVKAVAIWETGVSNAKGTKLARGTKFKCQICEGEYVPRCICSLSLPFCIVTCYPLVSLWLLGCCRDNGALEGMRSQIIRARAIRNVNSTAVPIAATIAYGLPRNLTAQQPAKVTSGRADGYAERQRGRHLELRAANGRGWASATTPVTTSRENATPYGLQPRTCALPRAG